MFYFVTFIVRVFLRCIHCYLMCNLKFKHSLITWRRHIFISVKLFKTRRQVIHNEASSSKYCIAFWDSFGVYRYSATGGTCQFCSELGTIYFGYLPGKTLPPNVRSLVILYSRTFCIIFPCSWKFTFAIFWSRSTTRLSSVKFVLRELFHRTLYLFHAKTIPSFSLLILTCNICMLCIRLFWGMKF